MEPALSAPTAARSDPNAALHDAYAAGYDAEVVAYDCHIAALLFGLCYEYTKPGDRLLDAGIGTGLSSELFARAGLVVYGMDFSPAMLEICQAKGFAAELCRHDVQETPWPYPPAAFAHVMCCGVMHFIPELEGIFAESARVLSTGGVFGFTTRQPGAAGPGDYETHPAGEFAIYSHSIPYVDGLMERHGFARCTLQRCFVGDDVFLLRVVRRGRAGNDLAAEGETHGGQV